MYLIIGLSLILVCCSKETEIEHQKKLTNQENTLKKVTTDRTFCDPVNFPIDHINTSIASSSTIDPGKNCEPEFYEPLTTTSLLENHFYCVYGLPPIELGQVCDSEYTIIPLYKVCNNFSYFPYPDYNSNSNYYTSADAQELQEYDLNLMVELAKQVMGNYDSIVALDFFYKPADCSTVCLCDYTFESDGSYTVNGCGQSTIYMRFKLCKSQVSVGFE